jgi:predicted glycosyltransferase
MGHLMRSLALTRSLTTRFDVTFVLGGELPPNMVGPSGSDPRMVLLPPVGLDEMGRMVSRDGRQPLMRALAERRRILLETYRAVQPQVLLIELFPFGRRKFLSELEPVLQEAKNGGATRPIVGCSLRDILVSRHALQRDYDLESARVLEAYFDAVLVHCDPSFARLEESIAPDVRIPVPVYYTGFVHDPNRSVPRRLRTRPGSIIVSAGGGRVGEPLLRKAIEAHALLPARSRPPLTIVGGPFLPEDAWRRLSALAKGRVDVDARRSVPNLVWELSHAAGSISQCGYNTAMDLLHSRVPALVVPFGDVAEDEQLKRAQRLESLGALRVLSPTDLTAPRLAAAMSSLPAFRPSARALNLKGAEQTAEIVGQWSERGVPWSRPPIPGPRAWAAPAS